MGGCSAEDSKGTQLLDQIVREAVTEEAARVREALTKYVRHLEVQISHSQAAETQLPRALRRYSQNAEILQSQLLQMEHQKRRRSLEVGALRGALQEVRKVFSVSALDENSGELAAYQMLTEIRDERERWRTERRYLEEQIREQQEALEADQLRLTTSATNVTDPEKERLKRTVKQLQMSIESRDNYACWICNQRNTGEMSQSGSEAQDSEEEQRGRLDSSSMEDEAAVMRSEIQKLRSELRRLRSGSLVPDGRRSSKRNTLTRRTSSRGGSFSRKKPSHTAMAGKREAGAVSHPRMRVQFSPSSAQLDDGTEEDEEAHEEEEGEVTAVESSSLKSPSSLAPTEEEAPPTKAEVRFDTAADAVEEVVVETETPMRQSRARIPTPCVCKNVETWASGEAEPEVGVHFSANDSVVEAASEAATAVHRRPVRGRIPTGYVHESVEVEAEASGHRGVQFSTEAVSEGQAASEAPPEQIRRPVRGRTPTGFIHESVEVQAEASPSAASGSRGVRFDEDASVSEAAGSPTAGPTRSVRGRIPTGFVREDVDAQPAEAEPDRGVRFSASAASEVEAASEAPAEGRARPVRGRTPTGFIHEAVDAPPEERSGVRFGDVDLGEAASSPPAPGRSRPVRGRTPTGFVNEVIDPPTDDQPASQATTQAEQRVRGVRFSASAASESEAASEAPVAGTARPVRGRIPTGFVHEDVDAGAEAASQEPRSSSSSSARVGVRFGSDPAVSIGESASEPVDPGKTRSVRGRIPTGFVHENVDAPAAAEASTNGRGVHFNEVTTEGEAASSPPAAGQARTVRGRIPTGFAYEDVQQAETEASTVRFAPAASVGEAASEATVGPARPVRGRTPTGYFDAQLEGSPSASTSSQGKSVQFGTEPPVTVGVAASAPAPGTRMRRSRERIPTGFINGVNAAQLEDSHTRVQFQEAASVVEAASDAAPSHARRHVRDRIPTGYIHESVEASPEAASSRVNVRFEETASIGEAASSPVASGGGRSVRGRIPTGFVHEDATATTTQDTPGVHFAASVPAEESEQPQRPKRTPTGFVRQDDLPPEEKTAVRFTAAADPEEDQPQRPKRTPTGFVRQEELPEEKTSSVRFSGPPADEDEEQPQRPKRVATGFVRPEEKQGVRFAGPAPAEDGSEDQPQRPKRTPTGFVRQEDLPQEKPQSVSFAGPVPSNDAEDQPQRPKRVPTGFVRPEELPKERSEAVRFAGPPPEEDEDEKQPQRPRRVPTGFVRSEELPQEGTSNVRFAGPAPAEDEDEGQPRRPQRVQTGFVRPEDIKQEGTPNVRFAGPPAADDEDEGQPRRPQRVQTGFVRSEEATEDRVRFAAEARAEDEQPSRPQRVQTGFVHHGGNDAQSHVRFAAGADMADAASAAAGGEVRDLRTRTPTGFVHEENLEVEADQHIRFSDGPVQQIVVAAPTTTGRSIKSRTPTGFVHSEGVQEESATSSVRFAPESEAGGVTSPSVQRAVKSRTPTGFVREGDIQESANDSELRSVQFSSASDAVLEAASTAPAGASRPVKGRTPTGYVHAEEELPKSPIAQLVANSETQRVEPQRVEPDAGEHLASAKRQPSSPDSPEELQEGTTDTSQRKVTFRKKESILSIEGRDKDKKRTSSHGAQGSTPDDTRNSLFSLGSVDSAEMSTMTPGGTLGLSLDEVNLNATTGQDKELKRQVSWDDDAASSCSSRNPRSRMTTPFISSVNLGFDCISQMISSDEDNPADPAEKEDIPGLAPVRKMSSQRAGSRLDSAGSMEQADRETLKHASLESSIEREIAERVRDYAHSQRQVRELRNVMASAAAEQLHNSRGRAEQDLEKHRLPGAPKEKELAMTALQKLPFFEDFNTEALENLIEAMQVYEFEDGDEVVHQGDTDGTHFFVVATGSFLVLRDGKPRCTISPSNCFGESVLLLFGERNATVCAQGHSTAYGMEGLTVRDMLQAHYEEKRAAVMQAVDEVLNAGKCDPLSRLTNAYQLQTLYDKAETRTFVAGQTLLEEGPPTLDGIMVLLKGRVSVLVKGVEHQDLEHHAVMGDRAVLFGEQPATLRAREAAEALVLRRSLLDSLYGEDLPKVFVRSRILLMLSHHDIFSRLHQDQLEAVASCCEVVSLRPGEELDRTGLRFVALLHGEAETRPLGTPAASRDVIVHTGVEGSVIADEALLRQDAPWNRHVRATGSTASAQLAVWRSKDLDSVVTFDNLDHAIELEDKVRILRSLIIFRTLPRQQLERIAGALKVQHKRIGETAFKQGEFGTELFIIRRGMVLIDIDGRKIRTYGLGDYFGERALLSSDKRSATVTATEETELWVMGQETFQEVVHGPCVEYLTARIALQDTKVTFSDLEFIRVIGRGGFGIVKLVRSRRTGVRYALKCVRKRHIVENGAQKALTTELGILAEIDHPFIVKFVRPFRDPKQVFFLMEVVTGGELLDALDVLGILGLQEAQFYTGSILLALEFLHARQIAYLDLKSENCLIDHQGYLKIIDFGIAQRITRSKCHVMLGTPIIMAPEMIRGKGYTTVADLWSLGICLYDFVIGHFPFGSQATTKIQLYQDILQGELAFPGAFMERAHSKDTASLIRGLLTREPERRLGSGFEGYSAIKQHPFFKGFDFNALLGREIPPPFVPKGETYGEDREQEDASPPAAQAAHEGQLLADQPPDFPEDADWLDPSPGWDAEFDF